MYQVGFIGYGTRATQLWEKMIKPLNACRLAAIADPRAKELQEKLAEQLPDCKFYESAEEMLEQEALDGVVIGTGCNLHTQYACLVAKYKLPLFLEKPVSINEEQLAELEAILPQMNDKTVVSFPLRVTEIVRTVKKMLDSGVIGEIAQIQAINNVNYGRCYYHGWYRKDEITGGLFVQKATHDLDYLNYITGFALPKTVTAMESKMVFRGDKPAGLHCKDCPEAATCPESLQNIPNDDPQTYGSWCCFAKDTGNHDSATVIMQYENGMHAVYSQNFIARKTAGKRGARFIGFKGTLEFNFKTSTITLIDHFSNEVKSIVLPPQKGHGGGDFILAQNFIDLMAKKNVLPVASLLDGIQSVKICLAAKKSAKTNTFVNL